MSSAPLSSINASSTSNAVSKRLGSLQAFQTRIAERIAQAQSQTQQLSSLLSVQVLGIRVLLPLAQVNELLAMPELTQLPLSKRWVLGLTVVRSEVLTVFDLGYCLRVLFDKGRLSEWFKLNDFLIEPDDTGQRVSDAKLVVLSKTTAAQVAFSANKVLGTVLPEQAGLSPAYQALANEFADSSAYVKGVWRNEQGDLHIELSLTALFKSSDFALIAS